MFFTFSDAVKTWSDSSLNYKDGHLNFVLTGMVGDMAIGLDNEKATDDSNSNISSYSINGGPFKKLVYNNGMGIIGDLEDGGIITFVLRDTTNYNLMAIDRNDDKFILTPNTLFNNSVTFKYNQNKLGLEVAEY